MYAQWCTRNVVRLDCFESGMNFVQHADFCLPSAVVEMPTIIMNNFILDQTFGGIYAWHYVHLFFSTFPFYLY